MVEFTISWLTIDDLQSFIEFEKITVFNKEFVAFKINNEKIAIHENNFISIYKPNSKPKLLFRDEYYVTMLLKGISGFDIQLAHGLAFIKRLGANSPFKQGIYEILLVNNSTILYSKLLTKNYSIIDKEAFNEFKQTINISELNYEHYVNLYKQLKDLNAKDNLIEAHSTNIETYLLTLKQKIEKGKQLAALRKKLAQQNEEAINVTSSYSELDF